MEKFTARLEERTDGKLKFDYYYGGSLVPAAELPSGLGSGIFDFGFIMPAYDSSAFPIDEWQGKLAIATELDPLLQLLATGLAGYEWTANMPEHTAELEKAGIFPIIPSLSITGTYGVLCKEDNSTYDSMANKRVRVAGETWTREAQNLGMIPVSLPVTEVYQAFQGGVIDCWMGSLADAGEQGFFDHGKYFNLSMGLTSYAQAVYAFNAGVWNSFPEDLKDIIWDETANFAAGLLIDAGAARQLASAEIMSRADAHFTIADEDLMSRVNSYHDTVRAGAIDAAPAELSDPAAYVSKLSDLKVKWNKILTEEVGVPNQYQSWAEFIDKGGELPRPETFAHIIAREIVSDQRAN
ncbi:hypothetical protein AQY21_05865 [Paracoccus sp. MKU1]|nr:hypothetical protein AQY21_05865 [Paracoccus sp. MKU1]